jgi:biotin operon repressor
MHRHTQRVDALTDLASGRHDVGSANAEILGIVEALLARQAEHLRRSGIDPGDVENSSTHLQARWAASRPRVRQWAANLDDDVLHQTPSNSGPSAAEIVVALAADGEATTRTVVELAHAHGFDVTLDGRAFQ